MRTADPNWPNKQGIRYHGTLGWVWSRGAGRGEVNHGLGARWAPGGERAALCIPRVLYILLAGIVVVPVHFLGRSIKFSLSQPKSFAFFSPFSSPPHRTGCDGEAA